MLREIERTLRIATVEEDFAKIRTLVRKGADINAGAETGSTPLLLAIRQRASFQLISCLVELGASVNLPNLHNGVTPLHLASMMGRLNVAQLLLYRRAWVDAARNKDGATPLIIAIEKGNVDLARFLLEYGANINVRKSTDGFTALHLACSLPGGDCGGSILVCLLLDKLTSVNGPDAVHAAISAQAFCGTTPVHVAYKNGNMCVVRQLLHYTSKSSKSWNAPLLDKNGHSDLRISFQNVANCIFEAPAVIATPCQPSKPDKVVKKRGSETQVWLTWGKRVKFLLDSSSRTAASSSCSDCDGRTPLLNKENKNGRTKLRFV